MVGHIPNSPTFCPEVAFHQSDPNSRTETTINYDLQDVAILCFSYRRPNYNFD